MLETISRTAAIDRDAAGGEALIVDALTSHLRASGYSIRLEVPSLGQSIDLVATRGRWLTAVEAKLRNWKRVLAQAKTHLIVADYVYVAVSYKRMPPGLVSAAREMGIGVFNIDLQKRVCLEIIAPERTRILWRPERRRLARRMRRIAHVT